MKYNRTVNIAAFALLAIALTAAGKMYLQGVRSANAANAVKSGSGPDIKPEAKDIAAIYREAEALQKENRLVEAVSAYEKAVDAAPDLAETYLRLGLLYFKLNLPSRAEEFYQKAVARGMNGPEVYFHLGYIEETRGDLEKALTYYLKSEEKGSGNPELFYNIGNAYARLDKKPEAIGYYKRAVSINPQHMDAFVNLSVVSFQMNEFADARFYLDKAKVLGYKPPEEYVKVLEEKESKKQQVESKK